MGEAAVDASLLPVARGTVLANKYRVDDVIASGGMGVVAAGYHIGLSQRVAIKFLRTWTPDAVARFEREARAYAKISSEHIVRVLDVDTLPTGAPFMIMEYLDGADLAQTLKARGRLPATEAVDYLLQACAALAEAHRNGIIHRDLKPANLFLTERPDGSPLLKVLDFGISKMRVSDDENESELTTTNALMGSPSYMSPEQLRAARNADERSDIWALGAVLYKLIAGRNPFVASSTPDLCIAILTEPLPPITEVDVPAELHAAIARCLEKDRTLRFADVGELARALQPWSSATAVERVVRTLSLAPKSVKPTRPAVVEAATVIDGRVATTVDPSVSDTARPKSSWRVPIAVAALAAVAVAGGWPMMTKRASPSAEPTTPMMAASATPIATSTVEAKLTSEAPTTSATATASASPVAPHTTTTAHVRSSGGTLAPWPTSAPTVASVSAVPAVTTAPQKDEFGRFGDRK